MFGVSLERVAGFKLISIEPPRSSVHHVEEEGEGFCEQQKKWNQKIGPKVLHSHPRLLSCPECTLLPKVMIFFFLLRRGSSGLYQGNEASDDPVIYSSSVFEMKRYQRLQMSCFHQLLICGHRVKRHKYTELSC